MPRYNPNDQNPQLQKRIVPGRQRNIAVCLTLLAGCKDKEEDFDNLTPSLEPRQLYVNIGLMRFAADASMQTLDISSTATPWVAECSADWVKLSQTTGEWSSKVRVSVAENPSCDDGRSAMIIVKFRQS